MNTNKTDLISIGKYKRKKTKPIKKQPFNGLIKFNSKKVRIFMETFFFFFPRTLSLNYSTLRFCTLNFNLIFHICKAEKSAKSWQCSGKEVVNVHEEG